MSNRIGVHPISWMAAFLSCSPIAPVLCWTLANFLPVPVNSRSELSDVSFGWPFAWIVQDQTRFDPIAYPMFTKLYLNKTDPVLTEYHWTCFMVNSVLIALGLATILWGLLRLWAARQNK